MRVDKFLKNTGIVKRRTLAKRLSDEGNVEVDGRTAKPSTDVTPGDHIRVHIGMRIAEYEVLQVADHPVPKAERDEYARLLHSERVRPLSDI
ncbi:MAG: S4 domain-containing protein [Armatimonadota bacterium]|nr:S4 domain-containing protein [Armatimonadota bacterium]